METNIPVGFAMEKPLDSALHRYEINVYTKYQRRGIGTALMKKGCDEYPE
ncbi:GNAT family N-acetyltransferase [bacterium]|nr:GNAT family N-acetyltransferase [bacterium]